MAEINFMTRLLTTHGLDYLIRYTDQHTTPRPKTVRTVSGVTLKVRAAIAALENPIFSGDDVAAALPNIARQTIIVALCSLIDTVRPPIRRISKWPAFYERLATTTETDDTTSTRRKRRKAINRTTQAVRRLQHAAATNTR